MFPTSDSKETQIWIMEGVADRADRVEKQKAMPAGPTGRHPDGLWPE